MQGRPGDAGSSPGPRPACPDCDAYASCSLPHELEAHLGPRPWDQADLHRELRGWRARHPDWFGPTDPPPGPLRMPAEYEPAAALTLAYTGIDDYDPIFDAIVAAAVPHGLVRVLYLKGARGQLDRRLWGLGEAWAEVERLCPAPFSSVWLRDFGPLPVHTPTGVAWIDGRYPTSCLADDALPSRLAVRTPGVRCYRCPLVIEGGNLLSDGLGTGFTTTGLAAHNDLAPADLLPALAPWFGFQRMVLLQPLAGNVIDHVDMFLHVASEDLLLLGECDPGEQPENHRCLEHNRTILERLRTPGGRPYHIRRVPMPPPELPDPLGVEPLLRSCLNLVLFNGVVMVPVYGDDPGREARALEVIQGAHPGRKVVPIACEALARDLGALHCITFTEPG